MKKPKGKRLGRRTAQLARQVVKIQPYRPKSIGHDVITTVAVTGFEARLPVSRGGARVSAYKIEGEVVLKLHATDRLINLRMGELEAIAVVYDKMQELA